MFKDIYKRLGIQILIYLIIMYLIPWISIEFFSESIRDIITALFLVVFNLLIIIFVSTIDSFKYKLNFFMWIIPGLLFYPTIHLFYSNDLWVYSLIYVFSYGIGMLLGWAYKTYGYQLKPGYKKIYKEEKERMEKERITNTTKKKSKKK
ncbi:MAG: hypothetical protein E7166_01210 [Firmicutes bacterium]|nr:hypothetical protein [Bacillota bacterium]